MTLTEFFKNWENSWAKEHNDIYPSERYIVINNDIDGFLSGMILCKYYNCKVVGFSSNKTIWLTKDIEKINLKMPIYVDLFVYNKDVYCIDQHIVSYNLKHSNELISSGKKLNPNLDMLSRYVKDKNDTLEKNTAV